MYKTEKFDPKTFEPSRFESTGSITLRGQEVPYRTVSEDNVFYDNDGKPIASIYSYSYFRSDVADPTARPVLFGFNGGPGSASTHVHAGFLGTKRVTYGENIDRPTALPPYEVVDNEDCLLDIADIVVIDPVGTGFGLLLDDAHEKDFYGIEEDAEALVNFIEMWLKRYNRWLSPKYLVGESYGCTRNAVAAGIAAGRSSNRGYSLAFDGIVMIGNTVSVGQYFNEGVPVEPSVTGFPTYAAVNWYHNHPSDQTVDEFAMEAKAFADHDYLLALYKGESLQGAERKAIIDKIVYYTGVSEEYLEENALKINDATFRQQVIRQAGMCAARFDGRCTRKRYIPEAEEKKIGLRDDASSDEYGAYYYSAVVGSIMPMLNVKLDRAYVSSSGVGRRWNKEAKLGTTAEMLRNAMNKTPGCRTFFANGWYDGATEIGIIWYTLDHAGLPKDRISVKAYPSGHMIYFGDDNRKALCDDIRAFVEGK